jgi:hypothetical protein
MSIPVDLKFGTICINSIEEEGVKKPEMIRALYVEKMKPLEAVKKTSPSPHKLATNFHPKPLNSCIMCRACRKSVKRCGKVTGEVRTIPT